MTLSGQHTKLVINPIRRIAAKTEVVDIIVLEKNMTKGAQRILDLIVQKIQEGRFIPGKPETYLGYKEVHKLLELPPKYYRWGISLRHQGLDDLAHWLQNQHQIPAITGLIIDKDKKKRHPGRGFFNAFNNGLVNYKWWEEEIRKAIEYDWSPYSKTEKLPTHKQLENFETHYSEGEKRKLDTHTRKRCEALINRAKSIFRSTDGELRCSVCDWFRPNANLKGDIVEIHHIRPVSTLSAKGTKWTLKEAIAHLSPLCPNCHRIAHSKPDGGVYSIEELKEIIR